MVGRGLRSGGPIGASLAPFALGGPLKCLLRTSFTLRSVFEKGPKGLFSCNSSTPVNIFDGTILLKEGSKFQLGMSAAVLVRHVEREGRALQMYEGFKLRDKMRRIVAMCGKGNESIVPTASIRKMISKARGDSATPIFMVHPVQGTVELLEDIASLVTRPVWGLECSTVAPMESAQALAHHYVVNVRNKQPRGPYTILAYSLGSVFALEMAMKLESEGETVSLTLLDGSPDYVKGHFQIYCRNQIDPSNLDAFRWPYVTMLFTNVDYSKLSRDIQGLSSVEALKKCARMLGCNELTFLKAVELFWRKLEICQTYEPSRKLKCRIRLIKASENFVDVGPDYDLSQYSDSGVEVITIPNTTHQTIITGIAARRVAEVINPSTNVH